MALVGLLREWSRLVVLEWKYFPLSITMRYCKISALSFSIALSITPALFLSCAIFRPIDRPTSTGCGLPLQNLDNPAVQLQGPFLQDRLIPPPTHRNVVMIAAGTGVNPSEI